VSGAPVTDAVTLSDTAVYALRLGDDALVLSHRLAEWSSRAPALEEDIALTNIGLDLLGQARALLTYAGEVEGAGRSEDDLAYLRPEGEFTNCQLVEQPNGDFAVTMARQLFFSAYQLELYRRLTRSADPTLAAVAAKAVKEVAYHVDHAAGWVVRLGDGTDESHRRMQAGVERMWPFTHELFEGDEAVLKPAWDERIAAVLAEATLERPADGWRPGGGRRGVHSEHLGFLLAEMQYLHRSHPGATW
jgi:ring-1,2-phenylacetyl-CoA epoxidase subunit PaaC